MKRLLSALVIFISAFNLKAQDIVINSAFGNKGLVTRAPDKSENILYETARSVIELPDGKLLLSVEVNAMARLTRYLADGTLDKTYATQGYSNPTRASQTHIVRTANGKILLAGIYLLASPTFVVSCYEEDGTLDQTFGNSGISIIETDALQNELKSLIVQKDGKLLLGGSLTYKEGKQGFIMRLLSDGTLDGSFAKEGRLKVDVAGTTLVSGLAASEKTIIAGAGNENDAASDFIILKYLLNGQPDSSFGENGSTRIRIGTSDFLEIIQLQNDGKIIAGGEFGDTYYSRPNFALVRLMADGTPDKSFNQTGVVTTSFGPFNHVFRTLLPDENGRIMVAGVVQRNGTNPVFARFNEDGSLDNTFADAGKMFWNLDSISIDIYTGLLKKDGSFIGVGFFFPFTLPNTTMDYLLLRVNAAGQPDKSFGGDGIVTGYTLAKSSSFEQPKLVSQGKILSRYSASGNPWLQGIMRYLPDGSADGGFADNGFLKTNSYLFDELPDKRLVTFETVSDNALYVNTIVMRVYTGKGLPDYNFGNMGEKVLALHSNSTVNAIKILPDGKMLLTGSYLDQIYRQQGFMVRLDKDGNLDQQFGERGYVLFDLDRNEFVQQPILQPDGKILVSGFSFLPPTYNLHFFIRRFLAQGMLDEGFGNKGVINGNYGMYSYSNRMLVQPDGKLLVFYNTTADNLQYESIIQRYDQKGLPDESFGDNSRLKIAVDGAELLKNGKLLLASSTISQGRHTGMLKLLNPNGSVDQSFGVNGTKLFPFGKDDAYLYSLSVKNNKAYITGARLIDLDQEGFLGGFLISDPPPGNGIVSGFTLVSAGSGKDLAELKEKSVIDLGNVPSGGLNIRANVTGEVGSVVLELQGPKAKTIIEDSFPYALFGDDQKGTYYGGPLLSGKYIITATPYSKAGGQGTAGTPLIIHFKVVYPAAVTSFSLIDAADGKELREIREGDVLNLSSLPDRLNIRGYTNPDSVGSVIFDLSSTTTYNHIESAAPYSLFGDLNGTYLSGKFAPGDYTLTGKPRSESKGAGGNGTSLIVHFKVVDPTAVQLLYGLTTDGGISNTGVLFSLNTATAKYNKLKDIGGLDGKYTTGSLTQGTDGKLYGMTLQGGILPYGSIFSFDPKTNKFASLQEFNFTNGAAPNGRLIQASNGKLYGMTYFGGTGLGNVFSFDPASNTITSLKEFNYADGFAPNGSLVQASDGLLYGMTGAGGSNSLGVIFSFDPETSEYKKLQDFNGENGGTPYGSLMQASDGKLYGLTYGGRYKGVLFSFDPVTNMLTTRKSFNDTDGAYPWGELVQGKNGKLYGMTHEGGNSNLGVLFSFDALTNDYSKLLDFNGTNGSNPLGSLMQASDEKLYGETTNGGNSNMGIVFSFNPVTNTYTKLKDFSGDDGAYPGYTNLVELSCTGTIYYRDADGDGYGDTNNTMVECYSIPDGYVTTKGDCDDSNPTLHPGASEICNGIDDNCNGLVDEGCKIGRSTVTVNPEKTGLIPNESKALRLIASPNPFSAGTMVRFLVPDNGYVTLQVADLSGRVVASLFQGEAKNGKTYQVPFAGAGLSSGMYLLRLTTAKQTVTSKVVKIK